MKNAFIWRAVKRPGLLIPVFFLPIYLEINAQGIDFCDWSLPSANVFSLPLLKHYPAANPASNALFQHSLFSASHRMPFLVNEIGISGLNILHPLFNGVLNAQLSGYGIPGYRTIQSNLGYGMKAGKSLYAGVRFNYTTTWCDKDWNYLWNVGVSGGILVQYSSSTQIGIYIQNPLSIRSNKRYSTLAPSFIHLAASHEIYEKTYLLYELSSGLNTELSFKGFIFYRGLNAAHFLGGYHSKPASLIFGGGYTKQKILIDFFFSWNVLLGITPALMLSYTPTR